MIPTFPSRLTTATAMVFGLIALSRVRYISKPAQAHIFRHLKFNWDGSKRLIFVGVVNREGNVGIIFFCGGRTCYHKKKREKEEPNKTQT